MVHLCLCSDETRCLQSLDVYFHPPLILISGEIHVSRIHRLGTPSSCTVLTGLARVPLPIVDCTQSGAAMPDRQAASESPFGRTSSSSIPPQHLVSLLESSGVHSDGTDNNVLTAPQTRTAGTSLHASRNFRIELDRIEPFPTSLPQPASGICSNCPALVLPSQASCL